MKKGLKKGFTLIELLVVIAIIAILATVVILNVSGARERANIAKAKDDVSSVFKTVETCIADGGTVAGAAAKTTPVAIAAATFGSAICAGGDSSVQANYPANNNAGYTYVITPDSNDYAYLTISGGKSTAYTGAATVSHTSGIVYTLKLNL